MKILYAIQGTGNGHISRARDIIPYLQKQGEVDVLISGTQADVSLPYEVKYVFKGLSFIFGKKGGIDYLETYRRSNVKKLYKEITTLPVQDYDLVISDFEPVSAWACYIQNKPCIALSHQAGVLNKFAPKPTQKDLIGKAVLKFYAPASQVYGFHFLPYDKNVFTPVIREEIRKLKPENKGHYTVYLPAFSDKLILKFLTCFPEANWQVFSKESKEVYQKNNVSIFPIDNKKFIHSLETCEGVVCGAGFETPAEVIFLQKKLLVIPMKGQYEQHCNATALKMMGVPVLKDLKPKQVRNFREWLSEGKPVLAEFPNQTEDIISQIVQKHFRQREPVMSTEKIIDKPCLFRSLLLRKIFQTNVR